MKVVKYKTQIVNCECICSVSLSDKTIWIYLRDNNTVRFDCKTKDEAIDLINIIYDEMKGE